MWEILDSFSNSEEEKEEMTEALVQTKSTHCPRKTWALYKNLTAEQKMQIKEEFAADKENITTLAKELHDKVIARMQELVNGSSA